MRTRDDRDRMGEAAVNHAAEAVKEIARAMSARRSGVHSRRDLESAIVHLRQATKDATEAYAIESEICAREPDTKPAPPARAS